MVSKSLTFLLAVLALASPVQANRQKSSAPEPVEVYRGKYVVVMEEGLAIGVCQAHATDVEDGLEGIEVHVNESGAKAQGRAYSAGSCGAVRPEPLLRGEVVAT